VSSARTLILSADIPRATNTMRRVRYNIAATLDGYIAGPQGEFDWIPDDPTVDFAELFSRVDTVLLGRRSYELIAQSGTPPWMLQVRVYVFSRTLQPHEHRDVTIVSEDAEGVVAGLRAEGGAGEIWLFGGGELFRTLLDAGQVDTVEVTLVPLLLGGGVPLLAPGGARAKLELLETRRYPSGMVTVSYRVDHSPLEQSSDTPEVTPEVQGGSHEAEIPARDGM
jgi:dihydrofolate reductase